LDDRFFLELESSQQESETHQSDGFRLGRFPGQSLVDPLKDRSSRLVRGTLIRIGCGRLQ
jgi:hypothetical protein